MSNIHTNLAMCALPVASAGGVVTGVRSGRIEAACPTQYFDFGTARMAFA